MANGAASSPHVPRIFVDDPGAADSGLLSVHGSIVHRLSRVLRLRRGDRLEIIHADTFHDATLLRVGRDAAEAEIISSRPVRPEPPPTVTLCPSLIRAQRFDLLMEKATELGASTIRPVRATRSLARPKSGERLGRWKRLITEAAEQCRREQRPAVRDPIAIDDLIQEPAPAGTLRLMASAWESERTIPDVTRTVPELEAVQILVGPEGGYSDEEFAAAESAGWVPVTLGPRPLRAETAGMVALAIVQSALAPRGLAAQPKN